MKDGNSCINWIDWTDHREETLKCPYCKKEIMDAWEISEGAGQTEECPHCGKEFVLNVECAVLYTTYRKKENLQ